MSTDAHHTVFISYAREDSQWVYRAADLLRAGGAEVFLDAQDIPFGDRWKDRIVSTLNEVERVLVFWSEHAAKSEWVQREWRLALDLRKRLVPVILDRTPLPPLLREFQALTELVPMLSFVPRDRFPPPEASRVSAGYRWQIVLSGLSGVFMFAVLGILYMEAGFMKDEEPETSIARVQTPEISRGFTKTEEHKVELARLEAQKRSDRFAEVKEPEPSAVVEKPTETPDSVERRDGIEELSTLLAVGVATLFAVLAFIYMLYRWSRKRERLRRERKKTQGTSDAQTGQAIIRMVFDDM
jgi:hypothetical protein